MHASFFVLGSEYGSNSLKFTIEANSRILISSYNDAPIKKSISFFTTSFRQ